METSYHIVIEGIDGCGKSTQTKLLVERLKARYPERNVIAVFEPGSSSLGAQLRKIAISSESAETRLLAVSLDRALIHEEIILPAIDRGDIIVSDRSFASTVAYQGFGELLDPKIIQTLCDLAIGTTVPDAFFWIDTPVPVALARLKASGKNPDYLESKGVSFFEAVREGYLVVCESLGGVSITDNNLTPEEISDGLFEITVDGIGCVGN